MREKKTAKQTLTFSVKNATIGQAKCVMRIDSKDTQCDLRQRSGGRTSLYESFISQLLCPGKDEVRCGRGREVFQG